MAGQNFIRVAVMALGLSTLSFAAGVAGDLSVLDSPRSGQRVVLRIPPQIPSDAPRAGPLLSTASAEAATLSLVRYERRDELRALVEAVQVAHEEFADLTLAALEPEAAAPQKPLIEAMVKPERQTLSTSPETKAA